MPLFLDTRGNTSLGIGICDRCKMKFPIGELHEDKNTPGLLVCDKDNDDYDPWRLPAPPPDNLTLPHYRPDEDIAVYPTGVIPPGDGNTYRITENTDFRDLEEEGLEYRIVNP